LRYFSQSEKPECKNYEQVAQSMNDVLQFCVDMGNSSWYGGAETTFQHWPLNKLNWTDTPYLTRELGSQAVSIEIIIKVYFMQPKASVYNLANILVSI